MTTGTPMTPIAARIHAAVRSVPDFPEPGVSFVDLFHGLAVDPLLLRLITHTFLERYEHQAIDAICGIDSRGFVFGAPLAERLGKPLIPIRKAGKLPPPVTRQSFQSEYNHGDLETGAHYLQGISRVLMVDDVLATGGSMKTAIELVRSCNVEVVEAAFVADIAVLKGTAVLAPTPVYLLTSF